MYSLLVFQVVKRSSIIFRGDIGSTVSALVVIVVAVVLVLGLDSLEHAEQEEVKRLNPSILARLFFFFPVDLVGRR
ncbi:hypothetical protein T4D_9413 [Trichinella pseudospiralis]|uniref:Uncharacterized protein n=1 Tax=Trichinella pseudospiralis TaxID=6337 RepID=A0A0V1FWP2_TRIPS|nr:hypothetical protein T4D_9413 [Trichinella pseudospiralis]